MLTCRRRTVQHLAFPPIEAREMSAGECRPVNAIAIDIAAARRESRIDRIVERRLVHLGERGFGRVRSGVQANDGAGHTEHGPPDRSVWRWRDGVERTAIPFVLGGVHRL